MLEIKTESTEQGKVITLIDKDKVLEILFGGNGDLYFNPIISRDDFMNSKPVTYIVDETDTEIYPIFYRLYKKITSYDAYDSFDDEDEEQEVRRQNRIKEERRKDSYRKYPLVHDGIISWHSDEDIIDESSILNISESDGSFTLEFIKSHPEASIFETYAIRFRNSGSNYEPFNCRFMELYNLLCATDFTYHQISFKEYMESTKQKTLIK